MDSGVTTPFFEDNPRQNEWESSVIDPSTVWRSRAGRVLMISFASSQPWRAVAIPSSLIRSMAFFGPIPSGSASSRTPLGIFFQVLQVCKPAGSHDFVYLFCKMRIDTVDTLEFFAPGDVGDILVQHLNRPCASGCFGPGIISLSVRPWRYTQDRIYRNA
jgi:hypothetical protein